MDILPRKMCRSKCFILFLTAAVVLCYTFVTWKEGTPQLFAVVTNTSATRLMEYHSTTSDPSDINSNTTGFPITLFVRMSGKLEKFRYRFYCDLFRSTVLYWPPSYGKIVMVLDEESELDHTFGENTVRQIKKHFPEYKLEVLYEALPQDNKVLDFPGMPRAPGYNRQLWSSFFIDFYTNDSIIAWMDTDAVFATPVTKSSIFNGTKLRVLGWDCSFVYGWVHTWARTTELALGFPFVVDFMTYFPVYIYRDTFTHCREHILKKFNTSNFEEAFRKFYVSFISPVSVVLSYAWYFERDRYDWNFQLCANLTEYNKRFPVGHTIGLDDIQEVLSEPQTAFHWEGLFPNVLASYCLLHEATGNKEDICSKKNFSLSDNFVLMHHDLQRVNTGKRIFKKLSDPPCYDDNEKLCLEVLDRHYKQVALEVKQNGRKVDWDNVETVEKLAKEVNLTCNPIA